jgi:cyclophilin family peptidyl-prolyl cis-trans isomerase
LFYAFFIIVMIASMAAVGFGVSQGSNSTGAPVDPNQTAEPTPDRETWPDGPVPVIDTSVAHTATLHTNQGDIVIDLSTEAPEAVNSFAFLTAKRFYNNTAFFFIGDYYAQAGDPSCGLTEEGEEQSNLCAGVSGPGYTLEVEPNDLPHNKWAVTTVPLSAGQTASSGSQFSILLQDDTNPDEGSVVFGEVVEGQSILENFGTFYVCSAVSGVDSDACVDQITNENALIIDEVEID